MSCNPLTPKKAARIGVRFGYPDVVEGYTHGGNDHAFFLRRMSGEWVRVYPTHPPEITNRPLVRGPTGGGDGEREPQQQGD